MATLIVAAIVVTTMFAVWLTVMLPPATHPIQVTWIGDGVAAVVPATGDPETPASTSEPAASLAVTLQAVTTTLSRQAAEMAAGTDGSEYGLPHGVHRGVPSGDSRRPGPLGPKMPNYEERWEIRFSSSDFAEYRRQLEFFEIELAAFGGSPTIDYVYDLTSDSPSVRRSREPGRETRQRFTWRGGPLLEYDRELLRMAQVPTDGRVVCQFYPPRMVDELQRLESLGGETERCLKTVFGVRKHGEGYEFYVISQVFRP